MSRSSSLINMDVINHLPGTDDGKFDFHAASRFNFRLSVFENKGWIRGQNLRHGSRTSRHQTDAMRKFYQVFGKENFESRLLRQAKIGSYV